MTGWNDDNALSVREQVEVAIAKGRGNLWIMRQFAPCSPMLFPYEQLVRIRADMGQEYADLVEPLPMKPGKYGPKLKPCGTEAAWRRHSKVGRDTCSPCIEAHKEFLARSLARVVDHRKQRKAAA